MFLARHLDPEILAEDRDRVDRAGASGRNLDQLALGMTCQRFRTRGRIVRA
jgi:hypothetical protein